MNINEALMPLENSFLEEVVEASGVDIRACYQCQKCSAGCPVVTAGVKEIFNAYEKGATR